MCIRDRCSPWAHWKARSGLPISDNWTFSLGIMAEALRANIGSKSAISLQQGPDDPKCQVEGVNPHQPFFFSKTRLNVLFVWYKNLDRSFFRFVTIHACDRRTDKTEFSSLDRVCIPCSAVKIDRTRPAIWKTQTIDTVRSASGPVIV